MFCGSIIVIVGLVVLAIHGQTTDAALDKDMTCGNISVTLNMTWNATYENRTTQLFKNFSSSVNKSICDLFNDPSKYTAVKLLALAFKGKVEERGVNVTFTLCLVQDKSHEDSIEKVFRDRIETGNLFPMPVLTGSFELKTIGVTFSWRVKDGECDSNCVKNEGCKQFVIEQKCKADIKYSCTGVKLATRNSSDCVKYCNSTIHDVAVITDWKPKVKECEKCSENSCGPFVVERDCNAKPGCSCDGLELTKNSTNCAGHCNHSTAGVTITDWKAKDGECNKCSKGGGGPFVVKRECTPQDGCSCDGLELAKNSTECVKYCDQSVAVVKKISSIILAVGIILSFSFNFWN